MDDKVDESNHSLPHISSESRTVKTQNGTIVNTCEQEATLGQLSPQKDALNTLASEIKGNAAT